MTSDTKITDIHSTITEALCDKCSKTSLPFVEHLWFSGRIDRCHRSDLGSIPGRRIIIQLTHLDKIVGFKGLYSNL